MGAARDVRFDTMVANCRRWFSARIADGTYLGFLVSETNAPTAVVAGGGLMLLDWPPTQLDPGTTRGYLLNVFVEPAHRGRGLARIVTDPCLETCRARGIRVVTLHASDAGRAVYTRIGFRETNEMRLELPNA